MMNSAFDQLDTRVQKWVYKQGWDTLRDIQEMSIAPILAGKTDLVISASTAAGKTEAAFLPACSAIANNKDGFGILYISPLKALINDQYRRLEGLCDDLDMTVTPWHGDSLQSRKKKAKQDPEGILLITPESLESMLMRESGWLVSAFENLKYIIIDEYHAFIGSERGCQLQAVMHRLECLLERQTSPIPRIALSATLGDMDGVLDYLRPSKSIPCELIVGKQSQSSLKMQVRGYEEKEPDTSEVSDEEISDIKTAEQQIALDLYDVLRGDSHLVFANSRQRTENFAVMLSDLCEKNHVPNEFFPHHGSLSKELRTDLESRLQKETLPTTAVCTMTLELGIDIGKVKSVAQVTAPHSVASLRQRIGRSGRRDTPAILRMYITEKELNANSCVGDKLRLELLQSLAMIRLLLMEKWYEPSDTHLYHFSTLLHQILAVIAQWGGVRPDQLWALLCKEGFFGAVTVEHFKQLVSQMGGLNLIIQIGSGELVLGELGEQLVGHYSFYAVFKTPEEYRVVVEGKTLGTLPIDSVILPDSYIVFGGRRWIVLDVDVEKKVILVSPAKGGKPPKFGGGGMSVNDRIRKEMFDIYSSGDYKISSNGAKLDFLDSAGKGLFHEGLSFYKQKDLKNNHLIQQGSSVHVIPWMGDRIVNTLYAMLAQSGFDVDCSAGVIEVEKAQLSTVQKALKSFTSMSRTTNADLAKHVRNKIIEKYDHLLPEELLNLSYGERAFDVRSTVKWLYEMGL
ncbi:ATP-dependent Lhr-like helicase [Sinobacterium caligoides]|uniref:ATP-dependent Lhr-like helicase n=1 Tax=Sinobacterium caligoides TaxID=933926 RepID=A0A3N2DJS5_9GAMM|nr:DEAD/DEAH box helicase [Sinobacterium caligoides]ROR99938.1 ATP-dependent Lhr-like helicase [Sinobacterium caligoides]